MPKVSKVNKVRPRQETKPGAPPKEKERLDKYVCTRCGKIYKHQKSNFPASQSPLFMNNGYLPVCNNCVDSLYDHYKEALGSPKAAMERICLKFDIYWSEELYDMINKSNTSASRVRSYISKTFLLKYINKSYDDTLDEVIINGNQLSLEDVKKIVREENEEVKEAEEAFKEALQEIGDETIDFWGPGFDADTYRELDQRFERWTKDLPKPLPIVDEALYKQICILEAVINKNAALGKPIEKAQSTLNNLLGSLNIKPNQIKDDGGNAELESTPLGVWAKVWEDKRPIPDYGDEIQEPKLIKYITTWFFGHIAKALGLKNMYSQVYEDEIAKYRVEKPEYENDEDDMLITEITSGGDEE